MYCSNAESDTSLKTISFKKYYKNIAKFKIEKLKRDECGERLSLRHLKKRSNIKDRFNTSFVMN